VVAGLGVTGADLATDLAPVQARVAALQRLSDRPLAVGFGLNDAPSFTQVRAWGATPVIGSALVKALAEGGTLKDFLAPRLG